MSYESLSRPGPARPNRPCTAAYHTRDRRRQRRREASGLPTVEEVADADNLIRVYHEMRARAGPAPGPDGLTYEDLGRREVASVCRQLSQALLAGHYRPHPGRPLRIPKPRGGHRTLRIANVFDRVVAGALHRALERVWEPVFLPWSMGFRPNRGVLRLLAELERVMIDTGRWVLAVDDIAKAFDNVILADVLADHARCITDPSLLALIRVVLRGGEGEGRERGIYQGSPYSPTALNARLHHAHDLGVERGHHPPRYRYADNLVYLCRDVSEGRQALDESRRLLGNAGFALKGEDGTPVDLRRGEKAHLLGFTLCRRNGRLGFALGCESWTKLEQGLMEAHERPNPARTAHEVLAGWVASQGPAFESLREDTPARVLDTAARYGFRESISREAIGEAWRRAGRHWDALRERVARVSGRSP